MSFSYISSSILIDKKKTSFFLRFVPMSDLNGDMDKSFSDINMVPRAKKKRESPEESDAVID